MDVRAYIERAAEESRGNASLWFRYLNKMFVSSQKSAFIEDLSAIRGESVLDTFQRVTLGVVLEDAKWTEFVESLDKRSDLSWVRKKYGVIVRSINGDEFTY